MDAEKLKKYDIADLPDPRALVYIAREADAVIAGLKDKLRHYPMMVALIESGHNEIVELKEKNKKLEEQLAELQLATRMECHRVYDDTTKGGASFQPESGKIFVVSKDQEKGSDNG